MKYHKLFRLSLYLIVGLVLTFLTITLMLNQFKMIEVRSNNENVLLNDEIERLQNVVAAFWKYNGLKCENGQPLSIAKDSISTQSKLQFSPRMIIRIPEISCITCVNDLFQDLTNQLDSLGVPYDISYSSYDTLNLKSRVVDFKRMNQINREMVYHKTINTYYDSFAKIYSFILFGNECNYFYAPKSISSVLTSTYVSIINERFFAH